MPYICFALAAVLFAAVLWPWPSLDLDEGEQRGSGRPPQITVAPRPDGRWAVQKDGTRRASKLFDRRSDAEARGREQADREGAVLVVQGADGRIQRRVRRDG